MNVSISKKQIIVGDVFSIHTSKGKVYLHFIAEEPNRVQLVRILPGFYNEDPDFVQLLNKKELFVVMFALKAAYRKKIVHKVIHFDASRYEFPEYMRDDDTFTFGYPPGWMIVDTKTLKRKYVKKLSPVQKKLSPWGIWNDTLLIQRLEEGWTLDKWV